MMGPPELGHVGKATMHSSVLEKTLLQFVRLTLHLPHNWSSDAALKAFEDGLVSSYASVGKADGIIVQRVFVGRSMPHSPDQVNNRIHNSKIPASLPSSAEKTETAVREGLLPRNCYSTTPGSCSTPRKLKR